MRLLITGLVQRFLKQIDDRKNPYPVVSQVISKGAIGTMAFASIAFFFFFLIKPIVIIMKKTFIADTRFTLAYLKLLLYNKQFFFYVFNSLKIGFTTTFFTTLIAFPLSLINHKFTYKGKRLVISLITLSMFVPPFVGSIGVKYFFSNYGSVNSLLMNLGIISTPIPFLASNSILAVVCIQVLHLYPIMYLNLSSTLSNVDPSIEEASMILGIKRFRHYKDIIWPLIRPGFFSGATLVFIWSFTDLGTPLMTNFHEVLSVGIFQQMSQVESNPYVYVMVFFMMCMTVFFLVLLKWILRVDHRHKMIGKSHAKRSMSKPSSKQAIGIYFSLTMLLVVSLIPHIGVLLTSFSSSWCSTYLPSKYTLDSYRYLFSTSCLVGIKNSLCYAVVATFINISIGSFVAYVQVKKKVFMGSLVDAIVMMPLFFPGIILAFSYVVTYMHTWLDPGKNPATLLIMAYSMRYIPYTIRVCTSGLQQLNVSLEEASRVFGASSLRTFFHITLPCILANLITSGLLVFSRTVLEVSESLLLATKEAYYPITKVIYALYCSHGDGPAKASALGLVALLIIALIVFCTTSLSRKKKRHTVRVQ